MDTVDILGVDVACLNVDGVLDRVTKWSQDQGNRHTICYANAHSMNLASRDVDLHHILSQVDMVYADGISIVWGSRILGGCSLIKMTGADWIHEFCVRAQAADLKIYILAGRVGVAERAGEALKTQYSRLNIVGCSDGFFCEKDIEQVLGEISQTEPHLVFVGMGSPTQEKWIWDHRQEIQAPVCWAVGALFDYLAGIERRVPGWMKSLGMEWLWRLMMDPVGKWKRYMIGNPLFVFRVLRQRFRSEI
jgi:N-acetylglucosaminyldiphosphoundecaprenol N-acetyl-beta-D-mannosaminyltransferase